MSKKDTLELKNVTVATKTGTVVLSDASLVVGAGEIHILMGPNGSGKSSLANAMMGHPGYEIQSGQVLLGGEDITTLPANKKAEKGLFLSMQYLPEIAGVTLTNFLHKSYNAVKKLQTPILEFHTYLKKRAEEVGITDELLKRELNKGLSGGEKKQSEMLQLLALQPKFAILDEIDSGVDVDSLKRVFKGVEILRGEGTGLLLITHYTNILEHITPDQVHIMREGRIVRSGGKELVKEIADKGFNE